MVILRGTYKEGGKGGRKIILILLLLLLISLTLNACSSEEAFTGRLERISPVVVGGYSAYETIWKVVENEKFSSTYQETYWLDHKRYYLRRVIDYWSNHSLPEVGKWYQVVLNNPVHSSYDIVRIEELK